MTDIKHAPGPYRLITYTNVNEERITRVFSDDEYNGNYDPADFLHPVIICADLPMPYAAAPELLSAVRGLLLWLADDTIARRLDGLDDTGPVQAALAAISKAKGGA